MSRLEELITELCPNGVEYKLLKECCTLSRGDYITKKSAKLGDIPVILGGQEPAYYIDRANHYGKAIVISRSGVSAGFVSYWDEPIFVTDGFIIESKQGLNIRFLYYYLKNMQASLNSMKKGGGVPHITGENLLTIIIPIPPLPVQREIVRILDSFTELSARLQEQLTAELTARRKQYEYYRDKLLTFDALGGGASDCKWRTLRSVVKSYCSGGTPTKGNSDYYKGGTIPWIRTQDVHFNEIYEVDTFITETAVRETSVKWIPENCVIVAISGASAGRCAINKICATTNQHCLNMEIDSSQALYRYVYHCVYNKYPELIAKKQGARGDLNSSLILETEIPIPPLSIQKRIVAVLDHFDTLSNGLTVGLPAEIEARQKQYEYYRDKLLTFKEKTS